MGQSRRQKMLWDFVAAILASDPAILGTFWESPEGSFGALVGPDKTRLLQSIEGPMGSFG